METNHVSPFPRVEKKTPGIYFTLYFLIFLITCFSTARTGDSSKGCPDWVSGKCQSNWPNQPELSFSQD